MSGTRVAVTLLVLVSDVLGCGSARPQPAPLLDPTALAEVVGDGESNGSDEVSTFESADGGLGDRSDGGPTEPEVVMLDPRPLFAAACELATVEPDPAACLAAAALLALAPDLTPEERARVELAAARANAWNQVDARAVGVLLPPSGDYARLGKRALAALELAFDGATGVRLVVRDTGGDPVRAAAAAEALVMEEHVAVVLGPIGRKETAAALEVLRRFRVPVLPLASAMPAAALAPGLDDVAFKTRASPEELTEALAKHARSELGAARLAILGPDTDVGLELANGMAAAFARLGGTVVRVVAYDTHTKDFHPIVKQLAGLPASLKKPTKTTPKVDFDALFIPEQALVVRRLAPFLEFWRIAPRTRPGGPGVQYLGGSGWNQVSIVDHAERLTENAVFADVVDPAWADPAAADFARRFLARTQLKPSAVEAEVFDAASLLRDALTGLAGADHAVRKLLRARLGFARMRPGVTGFMVVVGGRVLPRVTLSTVMGDVLRRRLSESEERSLRSPPRAPNAGRP